MERWTFVVEGLPTPKERPRFSRRTRKVYTPHRTRMFEQRVGWSLKQVRSGRPTPGPWTLHIVAHLDRRRRDLDNILKVVADALNGVAWRDDFEVGAMAIERHFCRPKDARLQVTITDLSCNGANPPPETRKDKSEYEHP